MKRIKIERGIELLPKRFASPNGTKKHNYALTSKDFPVGKLNVGEAFFV